MSNLYPNRGSGGGGSGLLPCPPFTAAAAPLYFPVPSVAYHSVAGALSVGKFPNPHNVSQVSSGD